MKKIIINLEILLLAFLLLQASVQAQQDETLFQEAKILIFDKKWEAAQGKLEEILEKYPKSPLFSQAVFYRAKCLEEQGRKELEALKAYQNYLELKDRSTSLGEEAEISIIDLSLKLYESGQKSFLGELENRLSSSNRVIRYYAAFQLSYAKDKKIAARGIPVLKEIIEKERGDELRDKAKIALLRIDPNSLKGLEEERYEAKTKILKIRVYEHGKETVKIDIPWALADLALRAISERNRTMMKERGYDLDRIMKELSEFKGNFITIEGENGTVIKIWIE